MRLRKTINNVVIAVMLAVFTMGVALPATAQGKAPKMNKQERVCLRNGNKLYEKKRFAEAAASQPRE